MADVAQDASFLDTVDTPVLELHRSNLLKVEVGELLDETVLNLTPSDANVGWAAFARDYVANVATTIRQMPACTASSNESCPFYDKSRKITEVSVPANLNVDPIGSNGANCIGLTKTTGNANALPILDCAVILPNSMWNAKDYLHYRCFDKRNLVLWKIAQYLSQKKFHETIGTVEWRFHNGDRHTPSLILTHPTATNNPKQANKKQKMDNPTKARFQVQIIMGMESLDWIPHARLFPNRANLKGNDATPNYNALLAQDAHWTVIRDLVLDDELVHLSDTMCLCKIWSLQRGFFKAHDGFGDTHLATLLLYLYRTKRANPRMAPLQVFTVFCKFLVEWWGDEGTKSYMQVLVIPERGRNELQTVASCLQSKLYAQQAKESPVNKINGDPETLLACYRTFSDGPVLVDATMMCNYFSNVSTAFCRAVGSHAKLTITALHSHHRPFSNTFLLSARFWTCMDAYMRIPIKSIQWNLSKEFHLKVDRGKYESLTRGLLEVLRKALGDRVIDLRVLTTGNGELSESGSDQIPTHPISDSHIANISNLSPLGEETLVLGIKLNPDTCSRIVDRGPPADDVEGTQAFIDLWGKAAQLRRFKDGAIVHAVIWNVPSHEEGYVVFDGDDKTQGGIVERIIRHVLKVHFFGEKKQVPQFLLREMLSIVDGVHTEEQEKRVLSSSYMAHKNLLNAFNDLSTFLIKHSSQTLPLPGEPYKKQSRLGIPLPIDAVEPLSPALRYSELFPPLSHPLLGGQRNAGKKVSGVICSSPILIQIRFGRSSKWPTDIKAMGAAKTAMLIQLANGIEGMMSRSDNDGFGGTVYAAPGFLDLGYKGYSWRIVVRADPELHLLRSLHKPSPEAIGLLQILTKENVVAASHHSMLHALHTSHPSSGAVVRLAKRWLASHMLSGLIPIEVIDLLVAKVYCDQDAPLEAPATATAGFMRVLHLLSNHNWSRRPLIVDPQGHFSDDDFSLIITQFEKVRGPDYLGGPPMYLISPNDRRLEVDEDTEDPKISKSSKIWTPTFSQSLPERVTLSRAGALAKRSLDFTKRCLSGNELDWSAIFRETSSSFLSYSALLRVDPDFVVDRETSSTGDIDIKLTKESEGDIETSYTRSMRNRFLGPKTMQLKNYRNLQNDGISSVLYNFSPIDAMITELRRKFGLLALFLYNDLAPEVVAILWRPNRFVAQPFSAMHSEFARPVDDEWNADSMVLDNMNDLMRETKMYTKDTVVSVKILENKSVKRKVHSRTHFGTTPTSKKKPAVSESDDESSMDSN